MKTKNVILFLMGLLFVVGTNVAQAQIDCSVSAPTATLNSPETICSGESVTLSLTDVQPNCLQFYETFSSISIGSTTTSSGSSESLPTNHTLPIENITSVYQAGGAIKIGTSKNAGSFTISNLDLSQPATLTFQALGWSASSPKSALVQISVDGTPVDTIETNKNTNFAASFETHTVTLPVGTSTSTIKFSTFKFTDYETRCFIDEITVSGYVTYSWNTSETTPSITVMPSATEDYSVTLTNSEGCTAAYSCTVTVNQPATGVDVQISCGEFTWIDGESYIESNNTATYTYTGGAANGCDSVVTLDLTVYNDAIETLTATVTQGDVYTENGFNIPTADSVLGDHTYTQHLSTVNGCDSVVTLNLTILEPATGVDVQTACGEFTWIDGQTYSESNNTATFTYPAGASDGRDSIVTLNLTILEPATGVDVQISCGEFTWIDGESYIESNNTATYTYTNGAANGCDSVVTLDLTVYNDAIETLTATVTQGDVYTENGFNIPTADSVLGAHTYTQHLSTVNGCDSVVTLNLTILEPATDVDVQTACGEFTWIDGQTYSESNNTATFTYPAGASDGRDSIVTLNLTILEPATGVDVQISCGEFTWIDGESYIESNNTATYTYTGGAANGCDSVVTLDLTILDIANTDINDTLTQGEIYDQYGFYIETIDSLPELYTYNQILETANGCDSIVTLNLLVLASMSEMFCVADTTIVLPYGTTSIASADVALIEPTVSLGLSDVFVAFTNDAPEMYEAGDSYLITWTFSYIEYNAIDTSTLTCTQNVTVQLPPCGNGFTVQDSEGNIYQTVRVGTTCWMAENLRATVPSSADCALLGNDAPTTYIYNTPRHNNEVENLNTYGRLYSWYAAVGLSEGLDAAPCTNNNGHIVGLCPEGWYLPTEADFVNLAEAGISALIDGNAWLDGTSGTNNTGFNALPGGYRDAFGRYYNMLGNAYFWTATTELVHKAVNCTFSYSCPDIQFEVSDYRNGYSVRCIKE